MLNKFRKCRFSPVMDGVKMALSVNCLKRENLNSFFFAFKVVIDLAICFK